MTDQGPAQDAALQEALHQSCRAAAGFLGIEVPEETPESVLRLEALLQEARLQRLDVGSTNLSECGTLISNQCFYLAIARSWLADAARGCGLLVRESALQLKREIEARVLDARGDAASCDVGEEVEAYADHLLCAMKDGGPSGSSVVSDLAIAVFSSCSGSVDVFEGSSYGKLPRDERAANLALIWHRPGHFEAVVAAETQGKPNLTLEEFLKQVEMADIPVTAVKA